MNTANTAPVPSSFEAVFAAYTACMHARGEAWAIERVVIDNGHEGRTLLGGYCDTLVARRKAAEAKLEDALRASLRTPDRSPQEIALVDAIDPSGLNRVGLAVRERAIRARYAATQAGLEAKS